MLGELIRPLVTLNETPTDLLNRLQNLQIPTLPESRPFPLKRIGAEDPLPCRTPTSDIRPLIEIRHNASPLTSPTNLPP